MKVRKDVPEFILDERELSVRRNEVSQRDVSKQDALNAIAASLHKKIKNKFEEISHLHLRLSRVVSANYMMAINHFREQLIINCNNFSVINPDCTKESIAWLKTYNKLLKIHIKLLKQRICKEEK